MEHFFWLINRPYITAFLICFIILCSRRCGTRSTLSWIIIGYFVAWFSEALSIRTGIPYGLYYYNYSNLVGDPLVSGVPFWDSLSYPFLAYAGFSMAQWCKFNNRWVIVTWGALFTMLLDVIIDPLAHLGDQWFLGKIYDYAQPGWYFDVPASNFIGWFIVAWLIIAGGITVNKRILLSKPTTLDIWFYICIALFNIIISFAIGAYILGLCSTTILTMIISFSLFRRKYTNLTTNHKANIGAPHES